LEIKNKQVNDIYSDLTDSIKYAGNIQSALLSSFSDVMPNFSEYFIFYQPSEILSGDFYWSKMINDTIYFASADSTGHGIPGALLSILGMSYLNEIVNTDYILPDTTFKQFERKN
jgi:sigma-B regulation protein RsbU (phosphoserine phosphatase)